MGELHTFGLHTGRIDGDLAIVHFVGPMNLAEGRELLRFFERIIAEQGHVYVLAHIEKATTIEPEARREFLQWMKTHPLLAVANVRGSILARSLALLMSNALRLFGFINYSSGFFENDADARRWIAQLRQKHQARPRSPL